MKTLRIKVQMVLAALGLMTALSMCGTNETVSSGVSFQAMVLVLLSGALLLNIKRHSNEE